MANVKFNKKTFEKEIGKLDEKMQERIAMFGTPLENFEEDEVEIEIFPNRPDLLSYQGYKRSFLAFLGKTPGLKSYKINKPEKDYQVILDSSLKKIRPFTACAIVKNLKLDDEKIKEIIDIQEKIHATLGRKRKKLAIGIYPLEKIKLPITFKAIEPDKIKFIPLESDREMSGLQILQRHPTGKDYAHLLAGKHLFPVFVDSDNQILSMPPIINSHSTGKVTEDTKEVFIECSGFDYQTLKKCLNIIVCVLADMGGSIYQMELKGAPEKISPDFTNEKMKISLENANKLLGINLDEKQVKILLEKMGHNYDSKTKEVEIPPWRTDILHEVDLIEDIAIAYGYENFIPEIPKIATIGQEDSREIFKRKISEILAGLGLLEISNYHLTNKKDQFTKMGIPEKQEKNFIELEESKTDYNILRKDLTHYSLKILSENVDSEYPQRLFEIGKIFEINNEKTFEKENLCISLTPGNFTDLKKIVEYLFRMLGFKIDFKESEQILPHFIDGRVAKMIFNNKEIGSIGEIHPRILKNWKIKMPVVLLELSLEEIFEKLK
ncbi:MAG: phenylalanine--tRNA ligase subunit beta [Nanobdellota archaeon]